MHLNDYLARLDETADRMAAARAFYKTLIDSRQISMENKFQFIAAGMASRRKAWDQRADKLIARMNALDPKAEQAFSGHESKLTEAEAGFTDMENAIRDLAGANGPPIDEGSPPSTQS